MDDFPGLLARDLGFKPQGKSAPMAPPRNSHSGNFNNFPSTPNFGIRSSSPDFTRSSSSTRNETNSNPIFDDHDRGGDGLLFNDVFGGPPKYSSSDSRAPPPPPPSSSAFDYDSIFKDQNSSTAKSASIPVFDKPVYDDDIFEGLPGVKRSSVSASASASTKYEDVFSSISSSSPKQDSSPFDDLLGNFGRKETESKKTERARAEKDTTAFDDLIPGFGGSSSPTNNRSISESGQSQKPSSDSTKSASNMMEDPFVVLESGSSPAVSSSGLFTDPLEQISKPTSSGSTKADRSSVSGGVFDDLDPLDNLGKSVPQVNRRGQGRSHLRTGSMSGTQSPVENSENHSQKKVLIDDFQDSYQTSFDMPSVSVGQTASPSYMSASSPNETNSQVNTTPKSDENFESYDDVWLTVSEIPLFTHPTIAPPPSRPPPPRPTRPSKSEAGSFSSTNLGKKVNEFSSFPNSIQHSYSQSARASARNPVASQLDELEDFAMDRTPNNGNKHAETGEDLETNSVAAAAMKEAVDKAEAKFRHAREMREREYLKAARSREGVQLGKDDYQERELREKQERLDRERQQSEREEEDREHRRLEKERERAREFEREREEKEREQRKERERIKELERERELARQAVERATREARERAAIGARAKAERAAVEKVTAGARERAEKAAVQRAHAEARERAAADAKERAERAAAEAKERSNSEAREKEARERNEARVRAERAAVERAAAEARERAAAEARERAAAAARANQQKNDNDLESFFSMGSRPSSAPRPRTNSSDPVFDPQSKGGHEAARTTSVGPSSSMRKASSTTNIVDDLTSIFGGGVASSSGEFQDVEGETEDRRRARLERHQRTQERAAKALAEKNQRDLHAQREQAERHRIAETLDVEIKRWAAGKEGNLRALLSTMQYVLWPECGWQPVSLTDLITAASVKKAYRKATLCIHPDKVQQKGANLQQKYIAEKVFDLLKEAWNKFNSEELF